MVVVVVVVIRVSTSAAGSDVLSPVTATANDQEPERAQNRGGDRDGRKRHRDSGEPGGRPVARSGKPGGDRVATDGPEGAVRCTDPGCVIPAWDPGRARQTVLFATAPERRYFLRGRVEPLPPRGPGGRPARLRRAASSPLTIMKGA